MLAPREHVGVRGDHVGHAGTPRYRERSRSGGRSRRDSARPRSSRPRPSARPTRGLRVVAIDDVLGPDQARQLVRRPGQGLLVDRALALAELFPVAGRAVETIVDPLRDREELGAGGDHGPARVDARAPGVGEQRLQQLRHSPASRRRVDVPDRAPGEQLLRPRDPRLDLRPGVAEQRLEALGPKRRHRHLVDPAGRCVHRRGTLSPRRRPGIRIDYADDGDSIARSTLPPGRPTSAITKATAITPAIT